jgi:hypothetical protein
VPPGFQTKSLLPSKRMRAAITARRESVLPREIDPVQGFARVRVRSADRQNSSDVCGVSSRPRRVAMRGKALAYRLVLSRDHGRSANTRQAAGSSCRGSMPSELPAAAKGAAAHTACQTSTNSVTFASATQRWSTTCLRPATPNKHYSTDLTFCHREKNAPSGSHHRVRLLISPHAQRSNQW